MKYNIKAHPTEYAGVLFRSRLEARWAAFFDLCGLAWKYEPIDLDGWTPDFELEIPCGHSECGDRHTLLVEVKPYKSIAEFAGHPCMDYAYGGFEDKQIPADASAAFGIDPHVTHFELCHGHGGGVYSLEAWGSVRRSNDFDQAWKDAGRLVQYMPKKSRGNGENPNPYAVTIRTLRRIKRRGRDA